MLDADIIFQVLASSIAFYVICGWGYLILPQQTLGDTLNWLHAHTKKKVVPGLEKYDK